MILLGTSFGCRTPPSAAPCRAITVTAPPLLESPAHTTPMTPTFIVGTETPTILTLRIEGGSHLREITFPEFHTSHRVAVLGQPEGSYTLIPTLSAEGFSALQLDPMELVIDPPPREFPEFTYNAPRRDQVEPGFTWFSLANAAERLGFIVAIDEDAQPVYLMSVPYDTLSPQLTPAGEVATVEIYDIVFRTIQGDTLRRYTQNPVAATDIHVPYGDFHHDLLVEPDGSFFALAYRHIDVPEYPISYEDLYTYAPANIREDIVAHIASDGTILDAISASEIFEPHRVGFDSLGPALSGALDWVHFNAVLYDADTDEMTISSRHQDAVVHFTRTTRQIQWIFGHPGGWSPDLEAHLLASEDPSFVWPTHQHGIELDADGRLRLFDNGNDLRDSPYHDSGEQTLQSRTLELQIDRASKTVAPISELRIEAEGTPLYTDSLGSVRKMPHSGNQLSAWGQRGRLIEVSAQGEIVWDVQFLPEPWRIDRAAHLPTLYPQGTIDIRY